MKTNERSIVAVCLDTSVLDEDDQKWYNIYAKY